MKRVVRALAAVCGAFYCTAALAAPVQIAEVLPDTALLAGVQSQSWANASAASLSGVAPGYAGYRLELIEWWGYELGGDPAAAATPFEVTFNGSVVTGSITRSTAGMLAATPNDRPDTVLYLYSLDLDDAVLVQVAAANGLAIWNTDDFSDWYWQTSGSGDEGDMAFRLLAAAPDSTALPEPGAIALMAAAGFGLVVVRRRKSVPLQAL